MAGEMMEQRRRKVPVFLRQAIRQGIGVCIAVTLGYAIMGLLGGKQKRIGLQWLQGCKWAAITIVVVAAPMLGKVTQVSVERTIGTIFGGLLGLATVLLGHGFGQDEDIAITGFVAFLVGFGAVCVGYALSLDYSAKLFVMTFVLVVMGSNEPADASLVALTRIVGIVGGVMLMLMLSVFVFPKSASHQAADNMAEAMIDLVNLSKLAWKATNGNTEKQETKQRMEHARQLDGYILLQQEDDDSARKAAANRREAAEVECEKMLMCVYDKLVKCDELLPVAANEVYFKTFRGRWCFLPALPWLRLSCLGSPGSWRIPQRKMHDLATCMRRVARVLWALHVTFQEGFEGEVALVLRRHFPPTLLTDLQASSQGALVELAQAFPYQPAASSLGLTRFTQVVSDLIRISEEQRNSAVQSLKRGGVSRQPSSDKLSRFNSNVSGFSAPVGTNGFHGPASPSSSEVLGAPPRLADLSSSGLHHSEAAPGRGTQWPSAQDADTGPGVAQSEGTPLDEEDLESIAEALDIFPPTSAGYASKVRWFSFQFLMQQLAEEVKDMHTATQLVLGALPKPPKKRRPGTRGLLLPQ
ncbi:g4780 [Coccomyxa elongata]